MIGNAGHWKIDRL